MENLQSQLFSSPTRQSIVAIVLIIFKYLKIIFRQIWPFLLLFIIGGSGERVGFIVVISIISGASMIWAILSYFKFYFHIKDEELIIQKGILNKTNLNIPFDRIQSINIKQNIVHQILNVVELEVDTAGTKKAEFNFDALSKSKAEALRQILLSKRKEAIESNIVGEGSATETLEIVFEEEEERKIPILNLSLGNLLKVGISQNHFRSVGFVMVGLFWLQDSFQGIGVDTDGYFNTVKEFLMSASFVAIMTLLAISAILAVLISLVRIVLTYFNATLWREGPRLKFSHGLFNKKEVSAHYQKIQILQWGNNPIQKMMGIFEVSLKQASSAAVSTRKSLNIQGASTENVDYLKESWLGIESLQFLDKHGISIHYFYRRILYRLIACAVMIGFYIYRSVYDGWFIFFILLVPYFVWTSWLAYKKTGFAINDKLLHITGGTFDDDYAILPLIKIQNVKIKQTPFQKRKELADIQIYSASGSLSIPYIPLDIAEQLCDYFLYRIEVSDERWM